ncbi:ATP-binding cassette domain-containing protein [Pseudogracilibacillus sp. SE30717A]|uniref:amino acid ABC transporter ATP-binding protein n=1 Tax=Pseudogracilibacillus sp. SE30717A TaxID=3098293 RepID=UPI00300E0A21
MHVLKGINLEIKAKEAVVILGTKDAGKSTLLRCIHFLQKIDQGEIWFDGEKITKKQKEIGVILRHFNLFPHKTVLENVMEGPTIVQKETKDKAAALGINLLEKVGLRERAYVYPKNLSISEKQRVAIARTLAMQPKIMLFDEPTSNLNPVLAEEIIGVIKQLHYDGMTVVITANEVEFSHGFAYRTVLLEDGVII